MLVILWDVTSMKATQVGGQERRGHLSCHLVQMQPCEDRAESQYAGAVVDLGFGPC